MLQPVGIVCGAFSVKINFHIFGRVWRVIGRISQCVRQAAQHRFNIFLLMTRRFDPWQNQIANSFMKFRVLPEQVKGLIK